MDYTVRGSRTHRALDAIAAGISKHQHGAISRQQARERGFSDRMIDWRVNVGRWETIDSGVYRVAGAPDTWRQRLMAACLAGPAVASHRSAGILWDFPGMHHEIVEVTALRHRRRRASDVIWHESYYLTERDITEIDAIPCTRPVRTFLDLGVVLSPDELETVLNEGIRRNLLSVSAIGRRLEEFGPMRPGTTVVQAVLGRQGLDRQAPESVLETRFLQLVRSSGMPEPVAQFKVRLGDGCLARIDFAYPARMIAIELDGEAFHTGALARKRDRRRDNQLGRLGWRVFHFDWEQVTRAPEYVVETLSEPA